MKRKGHDFEERPGPEWLGPVTFQKRKIDNNNQTSMKGDQPSKMRLFTTLFPVPEETRLEFDKNDVPRFYVEQIDGEEVISKERFEVLKREIVTKREDQLRAYYREKMADFSNSVEYAIKRHEQIKAAQELKQKSEDHY